MSTASVGTDPSEVKDDATAYKFWGYMFRKDKSPTAMLERLLKGIASCIADEIEPHDSNDLTPGQLALFYHKVGGDYDPLFKNMSNQSIAFIYRSLGCLHSLQPEISPQAFASPTVPALKPRGFIHWQAIQLLLGPKEHVPFLQNALQMWDVRDPLTSMSFPKALPIKCFPSEPDHEMIAWHHKVSETLRREAMQGAPGESEGPPHRKAAFSAENSDRPGSAESVASNTTAEERADAAKFFSRPGLTQNLKRAQLGVIQGSQMVFNTAKNMASPLSLWNAGNSGNRSGSSDRLRKDPERQPSNERGRRKSMPDRTASYNDRRYSERKTSRHEEPEESPHGRSRMYAAQEDYPRKGSRHSSSSRRRPDYRSSRRPSATEDYTSEEEMSSRPRQYVRRHNSHEPPSSPRQHDEDPRNYRPFPEPDRRPGPRYGDHPSRPILRHHHSSYDAPRDDDRGADPRSHARVASDPRVAYRSRPGVTDTRFDPQRRSPRRENFRPPQRPFALNRRNEGGGTPSGDERDPFTPTQPPAPRSVHFDAIPTPPAAASAAASLNPSRARAHSGPATPTGRPQFTISPPADDDDNDEAPRDRRGDTADYFGHKPYGTSAPSGSPLRTGTSARSSRSPNFRNSSSQPPSKIWKGFSSNGGGLDPEAFSPGIERPTSSMISPHIDAMEKQVASESVDSAGRAEGSKERKNVSSRDRAGATDKALTVYDEHAHPDQPSRDDDEMSEWWNDDDEEDYGAGTTKPRGSSLDSRIPRSNAHSTSGSSSTDTLRVPGDDGPPRPPPPRSQQRGRPGMAKQVSKLEGVGGRAYPKEYLWRS